MLMRSIPKLRQRSQISTIRPTEALRSALMRMSLVLYSGLLSSFVNSFGIAVKFFMEKNFNFTGKRDQIAWYNKAL